MVQSFAERGAQDDRRGAAGAARRPARRRGQHRDAEVGDDRRQRRRHPRHAARRLVAGPGRRPTSARPSTASCRRWPAAAGSPASASTRCWASSRSRPALDLRKDVLGWMGDAGVFVGGTTSADLGGALVIKTTDPAKTKRTMTVLERFARAERRHEDHARCTAAASTTASRPRTRPGPPSRSPSPATASWSRSAARTSWRQAISPSQQLGSSPAFTAAAGKLGNGLRPSFYLDFTQVTKLIESFAGTEPRLPEGQALPRHLRRDRRRRQERGLRA